MVPNSLFEDGFKLFADVADVPVDGCDPSKDVGDKPPLAPSLLREVIAKPPPEPVLATPMSLVAAAAKRKKSRVVPLPRTIKPDMKGRDVSMVFRALSKWEHQHGFGAYHEKPTPIYGPGKVKRMKHFQHAHSIKADGEYGPTTHKRMLKYFDAYGASVMRKFHVESATGKGLAIANVAMFDYHNCGPNYTQDPYWRSQGYYQKKRPPQEWQYGDCSATCLHQDWVVGLPTSAVGPYDGWTGSMMAFGFVVSRGACLPGDEAYYDNHVARIVSHRDGTIKVVSHGHQGGPFLEYIDYRSDLIQIRRHWK